jgi:hypothetical protein
MSENVKVWTTNTEWAVFDKNGEFCCDGDAVAFSCRDAARKARNSWTRDVPKLAPYRIAKVRIVEATPNA